LRSLRRSAVLSIEQDGVPRGSQRCGTPWNRDLTAFVARPDVSPRMPDDPSPKFYGVELVHLIPSGLIKPPLALQRRYKWQLWEAVYVSTATVIESSITVPVSGSLQDGCPIEPGRSPWEYRRRNVFIRLFVVRLDAWTCFDRYR
jgi:hypothetical protein